MTQELGMPFGEPGVLAYDELLDRVQCAVCGRWYQAIRGSHLRKHGLTIEQYKEEAGLNHGTALMTPRLRELQRQWSIATNSQQYLIKRQRGDPAILGEPGRHHHRVQWRRTRALPEVRERIVVAGRRWSDDEMLAALRARQAAMGGRLHERDLDVPSGERGNCPSHTAAVERFGSWSRVCELLNQPYEAPNETTWTEEAILAALRVLRQELGGELTLVHLRRARSGVRGKPGRFPSADTVLERFGSWDHMLRRLHEDGTSPFATPFFRKWTEEEMLAALRVLRQELGGALTIAQLHRLRSGGQGKRGRFPSYRSVVNHFGSWDRLLQRLDQDGA
jgi:hypothetical protein